MTNLKLRKKIENDKLYYLVSDGEKKDTFYEFYEFANYKNIPNIENIYYKIIAEELLKAYKTRPFSNVGFKSILLTMHGIIIDGSVINIQSANLLYNLIYNIRFKDLYNVVNSFRKNLTLKALEYYKNAILRIEYQELSRTTQELFQEFIDTVNYKKELDVLFKEIMFLSIINEYNRAYISVKKSDDEVKSLADTVEDVD